MGDGVAGVAECGWEILVVEQLLNLGDGVALADALGCGNASRVHVDWPGHMLAQYLEGCLSV